jgi:hypothetical protein
VLARRAEATVRIETIGLLSLVSLACGSGATPGTQGGGSAAAAGAGGASDSAGRGAERFRSTAALGYVPAMKNTHRCPKCSHDRILYIARVADR